MVKHWGRFGGKNINILPKLVFDEKLVFGKGCLKVVGWKGPQKGRRDCGS